MFSIILTTKTYLCNLLLVYTPNSTIGLRTHRPTRNWIYLSYYDLNSFRAKNEDLPLDSTTELSVCPQMHHSSAYLFISKRSFRPAAKSTCPFTYCSTYPQIYSVINLPVRFSLPVLHVHLPVNSHAGLRIPTDIPTYLRTYPKINLPVHLEAFLPDNHEDLPTCWFNYSSASEYA